MATSDALAIAKEQTGTHVGEVGDEARARARGLMDESKDRIGSQADREAQRAAGGMHRWADELHALSEGRRDEAGQVLQLVEQAAGRLDEWAGRLDRDGFRGLVGDVQGFARRRPGAFLLGAGAAGFLVGRMVRNRPSDGGDEGPAGPYGAYGFAGETAGTSVFEPDVEDFDPDPMIETTGASASARGSGPAAPSRATRGGGY